MQYSFLVLKIGRKYLNVGKSTKLDIMLQRYKRKECTVLNI